MQLSNEDEKEDNNDRLIHYLKDLIKTGIKPGCINNSSCQVPQTLPDDISIE